MQTATVHIGVLAAAVAAQTLLIGLDGRRTLRALDRAGLLVSMADGWMDWLRLGFGAVLILLGGLLPLLFALALGAAVAWILRAYSATPEHIDGLGRPILVLVLLQCLVLAIWLALLPGGSAGDGWQNDGLIYAVMLVLIALIWAFCNGLVLWRAAGGAAPRRDPRELQRLYEIGLQRSQEIAREALRDGPEPPDGAPCADPPRKPP